MKNWWRKWSHEVPLFISDALWEVLVVQFAALLDRLTLRQIIALTPAVILVLAYAHSIPIPPESMLVGDVLAYIDIFSVILLLGILSRAATVFFVIKQAIGNAVELVKCMLASMPGARHRREGRARDRKRLSSRANDDDGWADVFRVAWV